MLSDDEEEDALITIENSIVPPTIYLWDKTHAFKVIRKPLYPFDSKNYVVDQKEATSSDGVKIPYFIVYKKVQNLMVRIQHYLKHKVVFK
ncbi:prolyl endopeptidase domain protein [Rickettsia amblyommatis str. Ac/Pa]|uniref:Prolyl endopeptidase domain protein n=1 Tax=Rickettsia amblyommatis str. Ac/Pa TaxID=1359164 RepID=A0A0F3N0Q4_RICAM|nr:prolyl endopeptidase domain protein [Rickettsia amblyommatis str. Ac/Pa]